MRRRALPLLAASAVALAGCRALIATPPPPTPSDFSGLVAYLGGQGIGVADVRTGDAGCDDRSLIGPAISLHAHGLDQAAPVALHLYMFRDATSYTKLRPTVDACARSFVTDPATYEALDAAPFVVVGQGPWGAAFKEALRSGLTQAAGTSQ